MLFPLLCICPLAAQVTHITITPRPLQRNVKRFGINLSGQSFYDSGQMLRNLIARNPGFEGGTWQTILRCKRFTRDTCTDANPYTVWPAHFMDGARFEVLSGPAAGTRGTVTSSVAADDPTGFEVHFPWLDKTPKNDDFLLVRIDKPGDPNAGWWNGYQCGATGAAERKDLPPGSPSHQALRVDAAQPCQHADVTSYFDSLQDHSFVHLHGMYTLSFRAKPLQGAKQLHVSLQRLDTRNGMARFLDKVQPLSDGWREYSIPIRADDRPGAYGTVALTISIEAASILLDDVSLSPVPTRGNPTAFRDEVVQTLRDLRPGILRYMDSGGNFGSSLDDLIAPAMGRQRTGWSTQGKLQEDVALGLPEVLQLCEAVGAEPWIALPPGFSVEETRGLIEYLSGPASTPYGAKRAAAGHPKPWAESFSTMHLELGNEQWNNRSFAGATLHDPKIYGERVALLFRTARQSPWFRAARYDLVAGSWFGVPWWTENEARALGGAEDSLSVAPYLFSEYNEAPGAEGVFGPMFAQPEQLDATPGGTMVLQKNTVAKFAPGKRLSIYEVNLGTATGSAAITQTAIDRTVPSVGGGIAVANHMLMMLRELGATDQCFFALPEFSNGFTSTSGGPGPKRDVPLWGAVVDMGGLTNRRRPGFLALQAMNHAVLPTLYATEHTGTNPTWNQPLSPNDKIVLPNAHLLQSYAFADGNRRSLIVFNLSRDHALPVVFDGENAPRGTVTQMVLTAPHIEDNNEHAENVKLQTATVPMKAGAPQNLPPFSMTTFSWMVK